LDAYAASPNDDSKKAVMERMSDAYSKIDKAVKRGVLHTNNGARKKSKLAQKLKSIAQATSA
jgi:small subunit ribosomal protein S20